MNASESFEHRFRRVSFKLDEAACAISNCSKSFVRPSSSADNQVAS
jgi:hypothetical protein